MLTNDSVTGVSSGSFGAGVAGGIDAAATRQSNAEAAALVAGKNQSEESSSLLSKLSKGFTSFFSFNKDFTFFSVLLLNRISFKLWDHLAEWVCNSLTTHVKL